MTRGPWTTVVVAFAAWLVAVPSPAAAQPADTASVAARPSSDLAPTDAPPWNPPHPVSGHEGWEEVVDAPLTLVSLPIRALGAMTRAGLLRVEQDDLVPRTQASIMKVSDAGVTVGPASLGDRTGLGAGLGLAPRPLRGLLRAEGDASTLGYYKVRLELGPRWLAARYANDWRPRQPFYGIGMDASERDVSDYAMLEQRAELALSLRTDAGVRRELNAWAGERQTVPLRGREPGRPSVDATGVGSAFALGARQNHFVAGVRGALDCRGGAPHWSHGWRVAAQGERFAPVSSDHTGPFEQDVVASGFDRFSLEGQVGFSFMRDPRTIRLGVRVVDTRPDDEARPPAPYDLARLGGGTGLSGFEPGRFHDLDLALASVSYVFPLAHSAEMELSAEAGGVFPDVWNDLRPNRLEPSYSVMFRPRTKAAPLGAVGVSWSHEKTRVRFSIGGVE